MSSKFERIGRRSIYDGKVFSVRSDRIRYEDGEEVEREFVGHPGAVGVVVLDEQEQLWFVRQPREAVDIPDLLEIVAGRMDVPGEDPLTTAKRELAEEIGKQAEHLGIPRFVLHLARLHRRGDPPLPGNRDLRRATRPRRPRRTSASTSSSVPSPSSTRSSPPTRTPRR